MGRKLFIRGKSSNAASDPFKQLQSFFRRPPSIHEAVTTDIRQIRRRSSSWHPVSALLVMPEVGEEFRGRSLVGCAQVDVSTSRAFHSASSIRTLSSPVRSRSSPGRRYGFWRCCRPSGLRASCGWTRALAGCAGHTAVG